jgi:hypothetical protein
MSEGVIAVLILAAYIGLMKWVLPKLGIPT